MNKSITGCLIVSAILLSIQCSRWSRDFSILDSSPYIDYNTHAGPDTLDQIHCNSITIGCNYTSTTTNTDTSIQGLVVNIGSRHRWSRVLESGIAITSTIDHAKLYLYGVFDTKFCVSKTPVIFYPDIGLGAGMGKVAWSFDLRMSLVFGYDIVKDRINVFLSPRLLGFLYPWHAEGTEYGTDSYSYAIAGIYGCTLGLNLSLRSSHTDRPYLSRLKIKPEINYLRGNEPKVDQVDFSLFQVGCQFGIVF